MNRVIKQFTQDSIVILVGISCGLLCFTVINTLWASETPFKVNQSRLEQLQDINS